MKKIIIFVLTLFLLSGCSKSVYLENKNVIYSDEESEKIINLYKKLDKVKLVYYGQNGLYGSGPGFVFKYGLKKDVIVIGEPGIIQINDSFYRADPYDDFFFCFFEIEKNHNNLIRYGANTKYIRKIDQSNYFSVADAPDKIDYFEYDTYASVSNTTMTKVYEAFGIDKIDERTIEEIYLDNIDSLNNYEVIYDSIGIKKLESQMGNYYYLKLK